MVGLVGAASWLLLAAAAGLAAQQQQPSSRPHIVTVITDDMGFADTQVHNPDAFMTAQFGELARSGITLTRHHTYLWCSPTRRSFMTGRFPVHITGSQAPTCSNFSPLQFAYLPAKLKLAGYVRATTTPPPPPPPQPHPLTHHPHPPTPRVTETVSPGRPAHRRRTSSARATSARSRWTTCRSTADSTPTSATSAAPRTTTGARKPSHPSPPAG